MVRDYCISRDIVAPTINEATFSATEVSDDLYPSLKMDLQRYTGMKIAH